MKKTLTILLSIVMIVTTLSALPFSASANYDDCYVVGDNAEIFGTVWDSSNSANIMTPDGSGKYTKSYTVSKAYKKVMLKVVSNSGWHGDEQGKNYAFKIKGTGTFTVSFDSNTNKLEVTGSIVAPITLDYSYVNVVGNGSGNWLNGVAWIPGDSANKMTEISQDVWQIEYNDVPAGSDYTFKFVVDGSYETNFGGTLSANGIYEDAIYNADDNITFTTTETSNVIIILDLSDYDHSSKQGAKFTVIYETVEITYTLYDSYGDGWNNNSLVIKDMTNNRDFATLTMNSAASEQPGSITLIKGHTYNFIWNTGNYSDECGIILKNGDEILVSYPSMVNIPNGTVLLEYTAGLKIEKYNLWVGGTQVTSANAEDVFGNGTVKYNDDTKTLTLNNFTFEGAGYNYSDSDYYGAGIYCYNNKNEITLELIGTNTIKETNGSNGSSALRFTGSLKITGSGTLNAISCDASGNSFGIVVKENLTIPEDFTGVINATSGNGEGGAFAYGIQCWGIIDISDGTINATSGTGQRTYGIECENLIVNGGTINATSGDTTDMSSALTYGIMTKMSFIINGGAVTAKSGKTANKDYCWSYGLSAIYVYINGGTVITSSDYATSGSNAVYYEKDYGSINIADSLIATASENNDGSNAVAYNKNNNDNYKWFKTEPVHVHSPIYVPEVQATTEKSGHTAYYECTECHKIFTDADAKNEITDATSVVIPKVKVDSKLNVDSTSIYTVCSIKNKTLTVNWKKVKNATNYEIEYRKAGASKWTSKTTSGKNSYVIKGLSNNGLYEFRLRTVVVKGKQKYVSSWSNTCRRYIYQAKQTKLAAGKGAVTTTWSKDKNATSYEIQIATDKDFKKNVKKVTAKKSETKKTIKSLKKKKKYYVRIRAVKKYKDKNYIGQWSNVKSVTTKK